MNDERTLPRVTYSNIRADFSGVHAELDRRIGEFERAALGHARPNRIGGRDDTRGESYEVASPIDPPAHACRFHGRCPHGEDRCAREAPPLVRVGARQVACHFAA